MVILCPPAINLNLPLTLPQSVGWLSTKKNALLLIDNASLYQSSSPRFKILSSFEINLI